MRERSWRVTLNLLILAVACHSILGGILLLFFPFWTLKLAGWQYSGQAFWPSQAGLFLALLGSVYASAIRLRFLVWFLIFSKACALVFLVLSIVLLDAPKTALAMAVGDGLMGLCVALAFWKQTQTGKLYGNGD